VFTTATRTAPPNVATKTFVTVPPDDPKRRTFAYHTMASANPAIKRNRGTRRKAVTPHGVVHVSGEFGGLRVVQLHVPICITHVVHWDVISCRPWSGDHLEAARPPVTIEHPDDGYALGPKYQTLRSESRPARCEFSLTTVPSRVPMSEAPGSLVVTYGLVRVPRGRP